jgi:membrane-associated phospholipid phosphatase
MNETIIYMLPAERLPFLMGMYRWGIEVIRVIQRAENPALTAVIKFVTALGTAQLYVPLILGVFWLIGEKRGFRLGILLILSAWANLAMKDLLKQPRPFSLEPSLGLAYEGTYGAPSWHAQMSLTVWLPAAAWLSRAWAARAPERQKRLRPLMWAAAVFFILLIGFSRLYLGVHFPTDLFAGWILGGVFLALWFIPGPRVEAIIASAGVRVQNLAAAALALLMNGLYPSDTTLPAFFLGFCTGYTLMKRSFPFSARGEVNGEKPGVRILALRSLTGFGGLAVIYLGLRLILPGEGSLFGDIPVWGRASPLYELGRFVRYGLLGLWVSAGAPRVFRRMGLAE